MGSKKELLQRFSRYVYPYLKEEITLFILMILSSICSLATPYILKVIIDDVFPTGTFYDLLKILLFIVAISILQIVFSLISDIMSTKISKKISSDIREDAFESILKKDAEFFKKHKTGEIAFILTNDVDNIQQSISSLLIKSIKNIFILGGVTTMLLILDFRLAVLSLLFIPPIVITIKKITPFIKKNFVEIQAQEGDLNNFLIERIRNIRVIKMYGTLLIEKSHIKSKHSDLIQKYSTGTIFNGISTYISTLIMSLSPVLILAYGGYKVFENSMSLGVLIAFIQYANRLFIPTIEIVNTSSLFTKAFVSMKRVADLSNCHHSKVIENEELEERKISRINFKNISFISNGMQILKEINLTFDQGNTYILSGKSGSGKSTLINLLCGFIEPSKGEIIFNNHSNNFNFWKNELCLIEKENQLFNNTISENIQYGTNNTFKVNDILRYACLEDVIKKLDFGIETLISNDTSSLSDGQKQRISIARAINKSPSVFIFDESTASLDSSLEVQIINNIRNLFPKSIIIIISHREETLTLADHIYTINNGVLENKILSTAI